MSCVKLLAGLDVACLEVFNKYYQSIVILNRSDVSTFAIQSTDTRNRIAFNLKENKTGFLFRSNENSANLSANFSKKEKDGINLYTHKVQVPVVGVSEVIKVLLKQLDHSDCFAAIQFKSGEVEIYGFNYGLRTDDYDYQAQSSYGGAPINMSSRYEEYDPPYIYYPVSFIGTGGPTPEEQAVIDFDNLFSEIDEVINGDFNDDFNNDFNKGD